MLKALIDESFLINRSLSTAAWWASMLLALISPRLGRSWAKSEGHTPNAAFSTDWQPMEEEEQQQQLVTVTSDESRRKKDVHAQAETSLICNCNPEERTRHHEYIIA